LSFVIGYIIPKTGLSVLLISEFTTCPDLSATSSRPSGQSRGIRDAD